MLDNLSYKCHNLLMVKANTNTDRLVIDLTNNTARRPGKDEGTRKPVTVVSINQDRTHAVIRIPGGTHWSALYSGATYHKQRTIVYDITQLTVVAGSNERLDGIATALIEY